MGAALRYIEESSFPHLGAQTQLSGSNPMASLRFSSALSTAHSTDAALADVCRDALGRLETKPDLAVLFATHHHAGGFASLPARACDRLGTERLIGCAAEAVAGVGCEVEDEPAISLWLATLPGATLLPMHLRFERTPEGGVFAGWPDDLPDPWPVGASLLLLGEPFTFPADVLLARLNEDHPGTTVFGGMASGGAGPGRNRLLLGRHALADGAAAVLLSGGVRVRSVVSQGCRPIGKPYVVTKAEQNIVYELGGKPALERFEEVYQELATRERELFSRGLHLGRVVSEYQDRFEQGDFLVRNVVGADRDSGAIAIGDWVRPGQTVQFHVRDAETADGELDDLLGQVRRGAEAAPQAALLFTCNGRGTRMFPQPHHDASAVRRSLGEIPLAGFFAQGEIGPIGGKCFLHGLTASIALFEDVSSDPSPLPERE
jgi:small ligand-binding sensory domain FIST